MRHISIAVAAMALLVTSAAHAGLTFDTITGNTATGGSGMGSDTSTLLGASFFLSGAVDFNSVTLALSADAPGDLGSVFVYLAADDGTGSGSGIPGAPDPANSVLIGTIADSAFLDTAKGYSSLFRLGGFLNTLSDTTGNNEYWIVLDANASSVEWAYNAGDAGVGAVGQFSWSDANGVNPNNGTSGPSGLPGSGPGAFAMAVDAPEPTTMAILAAGLSGLGFIRRKTARKS